MKATLEFNLPEDKQEFLIASHAMDWALAVWELDNQLRNWGKYGYVFNSVDEAIEVTRERLREILDDRNISLDMIV